MLFDFGLEFVIIKLEKLRGRDMTKIAVLSDIHGNTTALEAVLTDAQKAEVDEYWLLGDILMPGTGRKNILQILDTLPITHRVLGFPISITTLMSVSPASFARFSYSAIKSLASTCNSS